MIANKGSGFSGVKRVLGVAGLALGLGVMAGPALAQEGVLVKNLLTTLGILPDGGNQIEYRERAPLVVPKDVNALRQPEAPHAHTKNSAWPTDPDVEARNRELANRNRPSTIGRKNEWDEAKVPLDEFARRRVAPGTVLGEARVETNEKAGVRLSPQELDRFGKVAAIREPATPPGTEPPRKFLTDPPVGLRVPSPDAPFKKTSEGPVDAFFDSFKPNTFKQPE